VGVKPERIQSFLNRWIGLVCEEIHSDRAQIVLVDRDNRMTIEFVWPRSEEAQPCPRTADVIRQSLSERRPLILNDGRILGPENQKGAETESAIRLLCFPVFIENGRGGAVCLWRASRCDPFTTGDLELLMSLFQPIEDIVGNHAGLEPSSLEPEDPSIPSLFIGTSRAAQSIRALIDKVKDCLAPVFICGESGTGKELIARAIHDRGTRREGPFVAVNCGAIPDLLLESELFGHARGAFTGALRDKAGLIEEANGGTFFLDEIGDLSPPLQAKLLRLLQEKEMRRIGETKTRRVSARFISATNKNIEQEVERENFRLDLYYRLRILTIDVPPLRERKCDLPLLIGHFIDGNCREMGRKRAYVSPRALEALMAYSWPGNVRELQNEIQRALILAADEELLTENHLSAKISLGQESSSPVSYNFFAARADFEKRFLIQALHRFGNNKARTAREIGLTRQGLFKLLKRHSLTEDRKERPGAFPPPS
jgi:transcriptional regulator with PAS, ATPase and Fis domain